MALMPSLEGPVAAQTGWLRAGRDDDTGAAAGIRCPAAPRIDGLPLGEPTIGKRFVRPQQQETGKRLRINDQIRVSPIRLIDKENEQLGVIEIDDAKRRAREAGLDLVEVAPNSDPPVCRIMDYGKWRYQQRKKEQKARSNTHTSELKEVRLRPKIDEHDLSIKLSKARHFLEGNDKVQFTMLFRGREMAHRELGLEIMHGVRDKLADLAKVESEPRQQGRRMTMVLSPERKVPPRSKGKAAPQDKASTETGGQPSAAPAGDSGKSSEATAASTQSSQSSESASPAPASSGSRDGQ